MDRGRPLKFKTAKAMQRAIDSYFELIKGVSRMEDAFDKEGKPYQKIVWEVFPEPPTITGLALHLGFESRQSILDYEKRGDFSCTVKTARLRVEHAYEKHLASGDSPTGAIFALKNFGWSDRQELDHTTGGEKINIISLGNGTKPDPAS